MELENNQEELSQKLVSRTSVNQSLASEPLNVGSVAERDDLLKGKTDSTFQGRVNPEMMKSLLENKDNRPIRVTSYRWVMLFCIIGTLLSNTIVMAGLSTISVNIADSFNVEIFWVVFCSMSFVVFYVPFSFAAIQAYKKFPMASVLIPVTIIHVVFSWSRLLMDVDHNNYFWVCLVSTIIVSFTMPFLLQAMGIIPFIWFPANEVGKAISFISLSMPLGIMVAFMLPTIFTPHPVVTYGEFYDLLLCQNIIITILSAPMIFFGRSKPEYPPSEEAQERMLRKTLQKSTRQLGKDCNYVLITIAFSCIYSLSTIGGCLCSQLLSNWYTVDEITIISLTYIIAGMVATPVVGIIIDKFKNQIFLARAMSILGIISMGLSAFIEPLGNTWLMALMFALFGFAVVPIVPVLFSLATKFTAPCQPSIVTGYMLLFEFGFAAVFGVACIFIAKVNPQLATGLFAVSFFIAFVCLMFVKEKKHIGVNPYNHLSVAEIRKSQMDADKEEEDAIVTETYNADEKIL